MAFVRVDQWLGLRFELERDEGARSSCAAISGSTPAGAADFSSGLAPQGRGRRPCGISKTARGGRAERFALRRRAEPGDQRPVWSATGSTGTCCIPTPSVPSRPSSCRSCRAPGLDLSHDRRARPRVGPGPRREAGVLDVTLEPSHLCRRRPRRPCAGEPLARLTSGARCASGSGQLPGVSRSSATACRASRPSTSTPGPPIMKTVWIADVLNPRRELASSAFSLPSVASIIAAP